MSTPSGISLTGYYQLTQLYTSSRTLIYRGKRTVDDKTVIIKLLRQDYPTPSAIARYQQEYDILKMLNGDQVIQAYGLERYQNTVFLVLEDFGGESLKTLMTKDALSILTGLEIAIAISSGLYTLHQANIIHKDINPANIVVNSATGQIKLIDFGISTALPETATRTERPEKLEGTLHYMAPEQTGRMSRLVDYRADLYSLGATLYEMFTGQCPFAGQDRLALVYAHLAKPAQSPQSLNPELPSAISEIILKLLSKNAEDRYQSALGLLTDLRQCHRQLTQKGQVIPFALAEHDETERLQISKKLYGRQFEMATLQNSFDQLTRTHPMPTLLLVSGAAGMGKTMLIQQLYTPLTEYGGYLISGKFEQLTRGTPYSAILQAFQSLIEQLLTLDTAELSYWRTQLQDTLAENIGIMVELLPDLALILDEKALSVSSVKPKEAQNRLHRIVHQFVSVFAQSSSPLVIVLDDLHWADAESLQLLEFLIDSQSSERLLLVGAYREQEVSVTHPLMRTINELRQSGVKLTSIHISNLSHKAVQNLLSDTLQQPKANVADLAQIILDKTAGNPFFINEFLQSLVADRLLWFDAKVKSWSWDLVAIQQCNITQNVVDLLTVRLQRLAPTVQKMLQFAACLGSQFTLMMLATISQTDPLQVAQALHAPIVTGLILPLDSNYREPPTSQTLPSELSYRFTHDRIQQAAYALVSQEHRSAIHWEIGQHLWQQVPQRVRLSPTLGNKKLLFEIVNQLNLGEQYTQTIILSEIERLDWQRLNLLAGQQAKLAAAFETAFTYLSTAVKSLQPHDWQGDYANTLAIYQEAAEAAYASSDYINLDDFAGIIFTHAIEILDTISTYDWLIQAKLGQNRPLDAIALGVSVLTQLGIHLPEQPSTDDIGTSVATVQSLLADRAVSSLLQLPVMTDAQSLAAIQIIEKLFTPAYFALPLLMPLVTLEQVRLSLIHGNMALSPIAYASYGILLCSKLGQIEAGQSFGQLALDLLSKQSASKSVQANTLVKVIGFIKHFKEPVRDNLPRLLEAYQMGLDSGALQSAAHAASMYSLHAFLASIPLVELDQAMASYGQTLVQLKQAADLDFVRIYHQGVLNLMGTNPDCCHLIGQVYDETAMLLQHEKTGNRSSMFLIYAEKSMLCYLFHEFADALKYTDLAAQYLNAVTGSINMGLFYFYDSLIRLAACATSTPDMDTLLQQVVQNQTILKEWASHAPENYLTWFTLVDAERHRILGNMVLAMNAYEKAILLAQQTDVLLNEALANELAGRFHFSHQRHIVADSYLLNARYSYLRWGAVAKVDFLDEHYPHLVTKIGKTYLRGGLGTTASDGIPILDVTTLLKSAQVLAAEIIPEKLISKLMHIVLENAGAEYGVLILPRGNSWWIEAEGWPETISVQSRPLEEDVSMPRVPLAAVNYVMRTQSSVVLDKACEDDQFSQDTYIQSQQTQSLLCLPLLNQGQMDGILYLENNLAQGVFDENRVETLKVLSTQAAISIENARLYERLETYNKTLEQRVEARTQELSQTLDVLKATQAELVLENSLLRSDAEAITYHYQVGGSLPMDAPTYVVRQADRHLFQALRQGQYCYVLNARQMGKSSLRIQMTQRLQSEGIVCATVDLSIIGNRQTTLEQWYTGFTFALANGLKLLPQFKLLKWWKENKVLPPVQRLGAFIEQVVLTEITDKIVLFIDEIDSVLSLDFAADDFFIWLRACFNQRADQLPYRRLAVVLLGVATPQQLLNDTQRTPFNIGRSIELKGFALHEAQPLLYGLTEQVKNPQAVLAQILSWTGGQPFLSQKICQLIRLLETEIPEGQEVETVDQIVRSQILDHWEFKDDPEHLKTIQARLLSRGDEVVPLLRCYQQILNGERLEPDDSFIQRELLLSGLVVIREGYLSVANQIYATVFDQAWIEQSLAATCV